MRDFKADCRSRRCLVEARSDSRCAAMEWRDIFLLNADAITRANNTIVLNPDGSTSVYIFGGK